MKARTSDLVSIIALTPKGSKLARLISQKIPHSFCYVPQKYVLHTEKSFFEDGFKVTFQKLFKESTCLICIMASGIVVREIAPLVKNKRKDPAILVVDEYGDHVISFLSGHLGKANWWTQKLSKLIHSHPVITTATDIEGVQSLDMLAKYYHGWYPDFEYLTKKIDQRLAAKKPVLLYIDKDFLGKLPNLKGFTQIDELKQRSSDIPLVIISDKTNYPKIENAIQIVPRLNSLGIGTRKAVTYQMAQEAFYFFCHQYKLSWRSFYQIASIKNKQHERAIFYLSSVFNIPLKFYSIKQLEKVSLHYPQSKFVLKIIGIGNVANSAADLSAGSLTFTKHFAKDEITLAAARKKLKGER